jgi:serine O-acetyltransferase
LIAADIERYMEASADFQSRKAGLLRRISILITPSLTCCALIRLAHTAHVRGWRFLACALARLNALMHHVEVDPAASAGPGLYIPHPSGIVLRAQVGDRLTLYSQAIVGPVAPLPIAPGALASCPILDDDVTIGAFATIVGPITIGSGAQVGPGVVVTAPIAARMRLVATGSMGRIVRLSTAG